MELFLFFDDSFLDGKVNIVRRFIQPKQADVSNAPEMGRFSIIFDEQYDCFRAWGKTKPTQAELFESKDGIDWNSTGDVMAVLERQNFPFEQTWFYDKWDSDPKRRYKMITWPENYEMDNYGPGLIACSADGISWNTDPRYKWYNGKGCGSDTNNTMFFNPLTKRWCIICRRWNCDRRVAIVESNDLVNWTSPRIILQTDPLDESLTQMYGMFACSYEDEYFIGLPQFYHTSGLEKNDFRDNRFRMDGSVDNQLVYSYDGQYWLRSDRSSFIPRSEPGTYGAGAIYPTSLHVNGDSINIFSIGMVTDHGNVDIPEDYPARGSLLRHTLRKDGFCCLESAGGWGEFTTKTIVPRCKELSINVEAPVGQVLVQVCDTFGKPLSGFEFENCVPIRCDQNNCPVKWKTNPDMSACMNKPVRIEFKIIDARIYALRMSCDLWYTDTREPISGLAAKY